MEASDRAACELCPELHGERDHRFARVYAHRLPSRLAMRRPTFVAMPTLGQLFTGSTLVLPWQHIETLAAVPAAARPELEALVAEVEAAVSDGGPAVLFEHGSSARVGGACGIHHAHMHVVPVPSPIGARELLAGHGQAVDDLAGALRAVEGSEHYAWARGSDGRFAVYDMAGVRDPLPSQHLRRTLAKRFSLDRPWDWRRYERPEPALLRSVELLGA